MSRLPRALVERAALLATLLVCVHGFVAVGWLRPVVVSGESMKPALAPGDLLLVRRWRAPRRWEAVVFRWPTDARRWVVKRVVGLPGEEVVFRGGAVWVDGREVPQPAGPSVIYGAQGAPTWRLAADEWLVVGDNQLQSVDSRNWDGAPGLPGRLIIGVVAE